MKRTLAIAVAWLCLLGCALQLGAGPVIAQEFELGRRLAVVIGNSTYQSVASLKNAAGDAALIAKKLEEAGFEVTMVTDAGLAQMTAAIDKIAAEASPSDHVVFYYSGHGFQLDGINYLVPSDANLSSKELIRSDTIPLNDAISKLQSKGSQLIAFIDACRDNPLPPSTRGDQTVNGLTRLASGSAENLLVAYAASAGQVALDGTGDHSPFTAAVAEELLKPNQSFHTKLINIRKQVIARTDGLQVPLTEDSLTEEFYFVGGPDRTLEDPPLPPPVEPPLDPPLEPIISDSDDGSSLPVSLSEPDTASSVSVSSVPDSSSVEPSSSSSVSEPPPAEPASESSSIEPSSSSSIIEPPPAEPSASEPPPILSSSVDPQPSSVSDGPSLPPPSSTPPSVESSSSVEPPVIPDLPLRVQEELQRIGCYPGKLDGDFGTGSKRAVKAFADSAGIMVAVLEPSPELLAKLQTYRDRVCPLVCSATQEVKNGQCVAKTCPAGQTLTNKGVCRAPAAPTPPKDTGTKPPPAGDKPGCFSFNGEQFCE